MNIRDKQYHDFFKLMDYEFIYYPEKHSFNLKGIGYAKICENVASDIIVTQAIEASKKQRIILLEGNLTYRAYRVFIDGSESIEHCFVKNGNKFYPLYFDTWSDWHWEYFTEETYAIAMATKTKDVVCQKCSTINEFKVNKSGPNITARCVHCGYWITNLTTNQPVSLNFGKYAGREISSLKSDDEIRYLQWLVTTPNVKGRLKDAILKQIAL